MTAALRISLFLLLMAVGLAGCAGVAIKPTDISQRYAALDRSALDSDRPSEMTLGFLKQRDLFEEWRANPEGLIARLDAKYREDPGPGTLLALMELTHLQARRLASQRGKAAAYDLSCALYAYLFLFDPKATPEKGLLATNTRLASEFHNRSLSRYLLFARRENIRFVQGRRLPLAVGSLELKERKSGLPFAPEDFSSFHLAFEYSVSGLDVSYSAPGLGAPLILVREARDGEEIRPEERFLSRIRQVLAATFFLRIETEPAPGESGAQVYGARIELYDPMRESTVRVGDAVVPLETDTTTPLAWMAAHAPSPQGIKGLMDPDALKDVQGLYMLQPYQKDKIPVVFVHGLISSPMTWLPMINGLMGDPKLRERYQFWYFSYPTGNPVFYSALTLRQSLEKARQTFDPDGTNPFFNDMIIVGHSMGGLLTKAMVQDSGEALWNSVSKVPAGELDVPPETRELVSRVFFFKPLPYVTEAVFIATPHRGSEMALGTIGQIGRALVTLPVKLAAMGGTLLKALAAHGKLPLESALTGIDALSPKNPMLVTSAGLPVAVPYHSIIGNEEAAGVKGGSDGVVPYWSSSMPGAVSELVVKSGHGAHEHPLVIQEVRRIMLEHADRSPAFSGAPRLASRQGG
ncbi:esterase/lipase family protein [Fundidesulfovibrio terrae]|uniref:esterase/lipase family protein n=1 Tax=Fundidesulfovibrio terrae TaxID=2922866 RepID=UPI001FAF2D47|nr:alpha/beta fold hydrolase [Fundidesulfovibrio terrae]